MSIGKGQAFTWNGAVSNASSGCSLLDYFGKCGSYRNRTMDEVSGDMASIFGSDELNAIKTVFYNRMITRKPKGHDEVARGQGNKDEFVKSLRWLEVNRPDILRANLQLIPVVGRWDDLWYDSPVTGVYNYVNTEWVYPLVKVGMKSEYMRGLIAKYLPKIRSEANTKNDRHRRLNAWARGLCKYLGWSEKRYRKFKSSPEHQAHQFQRYMCGNEWDKIDFNSIAGKALFNLVKGKSLDAHNLSKKYEKWIETQPVAKFTGYPFELYKAARAGRGYYSGPTRTVVQTMTYNKQFDGLIELGKEGIPEEILDQGVLCALDTSGSMGTQVDSNGTTAMDVCVGLGIYFSKFLKGDFADNVVMFDSNSRWLKLKGNFCDRVDQVPMDSMGSTNFQSVIDLIVDYRIKNPDTPIEDYPKCLLVVSDMQFNPAGGYSWSYSEPKAGDTKTNYEQMMAKLKAVGLPEMSVIWWHVNGRDTKDVPSTMFDNGTTLVSGFDPSIITAILGGQEEVVDESTGEKRKLNPKEMMMKCLDQEVLNTLTV